MNIHKNRLYRIAGWLFAAVLLVSMLTGCAEPAAEITSAAAAEAVMERTTEAATERTTAAEETSGAVIEEDGSYTTAEEVALYLHTYGHLPDNYITKKEAQKLGWDSHKGNLEEVAPGKSIGGSHYGNYEKALPEKEGRTYFECDLEFDGGYRGAKRLIYSDDGLIYYTEDHYKTFTQLY